MTIRKLREELRRGKTIYDLPLRVTFYARVSTEKPEQQGSLEHQIQYYTDFICKNPNWSYVPGYTDEGISGTSTRKRENFLRMISDAHDGRFDFIITKEISRFSRSTLDSILYTQELLDAGVGVFFQNDNINTLDTDSEFRLVVMAGVAQDEVRKLSERLKFGFRQSIRNGHVLGNDRIWGYDKKDCKLTVIPEQAEAVRLIFELYAAGNCGIRKIAHELTLRGYTSLRGNDFNPLTIRNILMNPKYKGWYCGGKTRSLDYRTKKNETLDESEWIMYPDPQIPAIVSEKLWDRANAILRERRNHAKAKEAGYRKQYPYSGKILCEKHGLSFHRQAFRTKSGQTEYWRCRAYRQGGKESCPLPSVRTREINLVLAELFQTTVKHKEEIIRLVLAGLADAERRTEPAPQLQRIRSQIEQLHRKKDKLLELSTEGALSTQEFQERNERFNKQLTFLEQQLPVILQSQNDPPCTDLALLEKALWDELNFTNGISPEIVSVIADSIVVLEESSAQELHLKIRLRSGKTIFVTFDRRTMGFSCASS
ncbi:MAG: recombinase family protein [Eubacteriales bacterium]|nr:recombinase family protein [Eubacteriales bacterium]